MDEPGTVDSLAANLRALGVKRGDTLPVHSLLSSLGQIAGGPQAVADALQMVLTGDGALVIPTHVNQYADPSVQGNPPIPDDQVEVIGEPVPPLRPDMTSTRGMSAVPGCFRNYPGVVRSKHPTVSLTAWGAAVEEIVGGHEFNHGPGDRSPLARVYDRGGDVLLPGVGHGNSTSFHLAECRADFEKMWIREHVLLLRDGEHVVVEYDDVKVETGDFEVVGEASERQRGAAKGLAVAATVTLLDRPALVDFAEDWFESDH